MVSMSLFYKIQFLLVGGVGGGLWSPRSPLLLQRLLIVLPKFSLQLLSVVKEVHELNLLPWMPQVQCPVRGIALPLIDNAAGVSLENLWVIMLGRPDLVFSIFQHLSQDPHILDFCAFINPGANKASFKAENMTGT